MSQQPENKIDFYLFIYILMNERFQASKIDKLTVAIDSSKDKMLWVYRVKLVIHLSNNIPSF